MKPCELLDRICGIIRDAARRRAAGGQALEDRQRERGRSIFAGGGITLISNGEFNKPGGGKLQKECITTKTNMTGV